MKSDADDPMEALAPKERALLDAKCSGLRRIEIARIHHISPRTYDHYIRYSKAKAQCATVDELVSKYTAWRLSRGVA